MKFITVRDLRTTPSQIWKALPEEQEMIITNNGKPIALMTPINETDIEETLSSVRQARAMAAVRKMQLQSVQEGKDSLSQEEIDSEIGDLRKARQ